MQKRVMCQYHQKNEIKPVPVVAKTNYCKHSSVQIIKESNQNHYLSPAVSTAGLSFYISN